MPSSNQSRRRVHTQLGSRSDPTTAEINEELNKAVERFHHCTTYDGNGKKEMEETLKSLRLWHRVAKRNGHRLRSFPSWALSKLPLERLPIALQVGDEIGYAALTTYFPRAHEYFEVERWRLLLYFDGLAQLGVKELIAIRNAYKAGILLDDMYDAMERIRLRRTNGLGVYKGGSIDLEALQFKTEDFKAFPRNAREFRRTLYGRNRETIQYDDESYRESTDEAEDDDLYDGRDLESNHGDDDEEDHAGEEGQDHAGDGEQNHTDEDELDHAEANVPGHFEDGEQNHAENGEPDHTETDEQGHAEDDGQYHDTRGNQSCLSPLLSICDKFVSAKEEEILSNQQCASHGRSLLNEFGILAQKREAIVGSLTKTEESINVENQAAWQLLLCHESYGSEDGKLLEEAIPRIQSAVPGLGRLVHKRRRDEEELADNEEKRARIEADIVMYITRPEEHTLRRMIFPQDG